jgi:hypothetical protein
MREAEGVEGVEGVEEVGGVMAALRDSATGSGR